MADIRDLHLRVPSVKKQWIAFLASHGLSGFSDAEVASVDSVIGLFDGDRLVGTGAIAGNVLKFIAVDEGDVPGANFNQVVSELQTRLMMAGHSHMMVFTKPQYETSFGHVGFTTLAKTAVGVLLEAGAPGIKQYLTQLPGVQDQAHKQVAAIVMNANPFTQGHRYLVEKAAAENEIVDVFVVSTDRSLFTSAERMQLVQAGVADLKNVRVYPGGDYMVSYATFPAYFLKSGDDVIRYQTTLDARLFRDWVAPTLHISRRYVGEEPKSHTTAIYNTVLAKELPPAVQLIVVPRLTQAGTVVTATQVRQALANHQLATVQDFLPVSTWQFIQDHQDELLKRIAKGVNIRGN
ncbi:MAG: [citrate (pro-3S)-lyase] ligase [Schleiferilactobacillus perolens]|jgi:[citrate (pro-3S)-lyase] ligase|uniref:[citrate (pro-3S)-lyase] ligase n=1 Tax=Schleiferilactobacillus perolens TaxID=100468 RepID=UPI0039ED45ED|nr:[citrate (pro-3S)-lyase] ligase [Schleiferilactobacillus harbinensis]MCI1911691.1 [citrate (pro-3S)-lyase] ligase [Schleiferilactobacillus harbinensis]